jgi:hypothetical protein
MILTILYMLKGYMLLAGLLELKMQLALPDRTPDDVDIAEALSMIGTEDYWLIAIQI